MITSHEFFPVYEAPADVQSKALQLFHQTVERNDIGFYRFSTDKAAATSAKTMAHRFAHKKLFVHVGIGGSSLGPEMLISCLGLTAGKRIQFLNNIDPQQFARLMPEWSVSETLFYIVSKSGGTAETLAALSIITQWFEKQKISSAQWKEHLVLCTDPQKGELRQFAKDFHLPCLEVPSTVGGRFSVLTDVGLFPAAWAGIAVDQLLQGAESIKPSLQKTGKENLILQLALWLMHLQKQGKNLTVLMPYSSLLKDFTAWWVQLWAESLGKEGKGLTPVMAYGATDQHSQMQLFMQGPADKAMLMLQVQKSSFDFALKSGLNYPHLKLLESFQLSQLLEAEFTGTIQALKEAQKPYAHLSLQQLDAHSLGQLIFSMECLTVLVGKLLEIDPFNQPGVEAGKKYAQEWLSRHRGSADKL